MRIIDTHAHLGPCRVFGLNVTEEDLLRTMDKNNVEAAIVQPFPGAPDAKAIHDDITTLAKRYPQRIFGLASLNPHMDKKEYVAEMRRCIEELGFVGIKLHTIGHALFPLSEDGETVFKTAEDLGVPVMVHTGPGTPLALPALTIPKAKEHLNLSIILAHAGFAIYTAEAYVAAKECFNIYLETSWCISDDIKWLVNTLGADRIMFGSDSLTNVPVELAKFKAIGLKEEDLAKCLSGTAEAVFNLKF